MIRTILITISAAITLFFLISISSCNRAPDPKWHSKIASIGGCDILGYCGVKLENGTILRDVTQPVLGAYPSCYKSFCAEVAQ